MNSKYGWIVVGFACCLIFVGIVAGYFGQLEAATDDVPLAFTYQGYLEENGLPVNKSASMTFSLFSTATGGLALESVTVNPVDVVNGVFAAELAFSEPNFDGSTLYVEVNVDGTVLTPRQKLTSVPYAIRAGAVDYADIDGAPVPNAHNHLGQTWTASNNGLTITGSSSNQSILTLSNSSSSNSGSVLNIEGSGYDGIKMGEVGNDGLFISKAGDDGVHVSGADGDAFFAIRAGNYGVNISEAKHFGVYIREVTTSETLEPSFLSGDGFRVDSAADDGFHVTNAADDGIDIENVGDNGVNVKTTGDHGVYVQNAGEDGVQVASAGSNGLEVQNANNHGLYVENAGNGGVYINYAKDDGVEVERADDDGLLVDDVAGYGLHIRNNISGGGSSRMKAAALFNGDIILTGGRVCFAALPSGEADPTSCYIPIVRGLEETNSRVAAIDPVEIGNVILDADGTATVTLTDAFVSNFGEYHYDLTPVGGFAQLYIAEEVSEGTFKIAGGTEGMKVSWQVTGMSASE